MMVLLSDRPKEEQADAFNCAHFSAFLVPLRFTKMFILRFTFFFFFLYFIYYSYAFAALGILNQKCEHSDSHDGKPRCGFLIH